MSDAKEQGAQMAETATPTEEPSEASLSNEASPSDDASLSDEAGWGTPWSAVETGWDGDESASPHADSTLPPYTLSDAAFAGTSSDGPPLPPDSTGGTLSAPSASPPPVPTALDNDDEDEDAKKERGQGRPMTLMEHLAELRNRLVRSLIAVGLAFTVCYSFAEILFKELCRPVVAALPPGSKLIFTALPEAFFVHLQVGFVASIFMASPYIFYQIWGFIAPGLYDEEKRYMIPLALCSALFFLAGAGFCYFVVFPFAFTFFVGYANESIAAMPSLSEYLGFTLKLLIAFGLIFEMPLFALFLARMGLITATMMRNVRRYAILVIFIVAAILTPPDVISQLLMATPMIVLYECSILVAAAFGKKPKAEASADEDTDPPDQVPPDQVPKDQTQTA